MANDKNMFRGGVSIKIKKRIGILGIIFTVITGVTFSIGIVNNPAFNIHDFCAGLSSEFIGWILAVTVFQYYLEEKLAVRKKKNDDDHSISLADEILKLKSLLDNGMLTPEEFTHCKNRLLQK